MDFPLVHCRMCRLGCAVSWRVLGKWFPKGNIGGIRFTFVSLGFWLGVWASWGSSNCNGEKENHLSELFLVQLEINFVLLKAFAPDFEPSFDSPFIGPQNNLGWKRPLLVLSPCLSSKQTQSWVSSVAIQDRFLTGWKFAQILCPVWCLL